jgi:hypothetical protein
MAVLVGPTRPDLSGPLAQLCLGRDGAFYIIAAGRAYHAGAGNWQGVSCLRDPRAPEKVVHRLAEIIRFFLLMIAAGYEDGNDADTLRRDRLCHGSEQRIRQCQDT